MREVAVPRANFLSPLFFLRRGLPCVRALAASPGFMTARSRRGERVCLGVPSGCRRRGTVLRRRRARCPGTGGLGNLAFTYPGLELSCWQVGADTSLSLISHLRTFQREISRPPRSHQTTARPRSTRKDRKATQTQAARQEGRGRRPPSAHPHVHHGGRRPRGRRRGCRRARLGRLRRSRRHRGRDPKRRRGHRRRRPNRRRRELLRKSREGRRRASRRQPFRHAGAIRGRRLDARDRRGQTDGRSSANQTRARRGGGTAKRDRGRGGQREGVRGTTQGW